MPVVKDVIWLPFKKSDVTSGKPPNVFDINDVSNWFDKSRLVREFSPTKAFGPMNVMRELDSLSVLTLLNPTDIFVGRVVRSKLDKSSSVSSVKPAKLLPDTLVMGLFVMISEVSCGSP